MFGAPYLTSTHRLAATAGNLAMREGLIRSGICREHALYVCVAQEVFISAALSIWPPLVLAFLGHVLGGAGFVAWWAFCFLTLLAFGQCVTWLFSNLGPAYGGAAHAVFFVLNIVSSTSVTAMEQMPHFFQIAKGLPFYNAVAGAHPSPITYYSSLHQARAPSCSVPTTGCGPTRACSSAGWAWFGCPPR